MSDKDLRHPLAVILEFEVGFSQKDADYTVEMVEKYVGHFDEAHVDALVAELCNEHSAYVRKNIVLRAAAELGRQHVMGYLKSLSVAQSYEIVYRAAEFLNKK